VAIFASGFAYPRPQQPAELRLVDVIPLRGETHHVQGIEVDGPRLWVTSVDRFSRRALLFAFDLPGGAVRESIEMQHGSRYHPGGVSSDAESLWIPLAEYTPAGSSVIQRRSRKTLRLISEFSVPDHIGCVAVTPERIIGANWDARELYFWTHEGKLIRKAANPTGNAFQDLKFSEGRLVGSGLLTDKSGAIDWLELPSLRPVRRIPVGRTDRGVAYTQEGMAISDRNLWLLPEDAPSRLFVFRLGE
jgi:hypothetical protein